MMTGSPNIMIVAAESSGDELGAELACALRNELGPATRLIGVGGPAMADQGIVSPFDIRQLSIVGLFDGLWIYGKILRMVETTVEMAVNQRPDAVVLIDSWGFSIRIAERLRRRAPEIPIIKYVGPQVWAHRPGRAGKLAAVTDLLLSTQIRDAPYYDGTGLPVEFVGDRALNMKLSDRNPEDFRRCHEIPPQAPVLLVLPGSRKTEVQRLWPRFQAAADRLIECVPGLRIVVAVAPPVAEDIMVRIADWNQSPVVVAGTNEKYDAFAAGTAALACSGTVTTELAVAGCPVAVAYRLGPVTFEIARHLVHIDHICLLNIAAGRTIVPEFIQGNCTSEALANAVYFWLTDPAERTAQQGRQTRILKVMGRSGIDPSVAAARAIANFLSERKLPTANLRLS